MTDVRNVRSHPIDVPGVDSLATAMEWLGRQSEAVRAVTTVDGDGRLRQRPVIDPGSFVDPTAVLIGGIVIRRACYVGPYAVIRLDEQTGFDPFVLDESSNIQDCAIVHAQTARIGRRVIVAHQAIVHGATVEDDVTIYIQAVVDGDTVLGSGCFLHQGSYVGKGLRLGPGRYVAPGQKVMSQAEADALPEVPAALLEVRAAVLEHNRQHVHSHRILPG
jgi:carbonic anhydrase/acetyltransferase-like protein (isoleucine patch superfamily)